jgi:TatD DNase family protein
MMDLHCHVDLYPDPQKIINDIKNTGFFVLSVTTTPSAWVGTLKLTSDIEKVKTALGLHPQLAHLREGELVLFDKYVYQTRYIGEIGLDKSKNFSPYLASQLRVFHHILRKCSECEGKILTIHSLNATNEVIDILLQYPNSGIPIFHWFLGTKKNITQSVELGAYFSIGPAMLQSKRGLKNIDWMPKDRVLLETDGPFAKYNNEIVYPVDVCYVIEHLGSLWGMPVLEVEAQLKDNLRRLVS